LVLHETFTINNKMDQVALPKDSPSKLKKEKSKLNNRKLKKKIKDKKKKLKQRKKKKKHYSSESSDSSSSSTSSSSSSDSSDDETARKHKKKRKKNKDKLKKKKSKKSKNDEKGKKVEKTSDKIAKQITDTTVSNEADVGPNISLSSSKIRAPMTKAEWEKQQSELRWIVDPETGRKRLIRGSGEIMEEIVSKERHRAINKDATAADGHYYQTQSLNMAKYST